MRVHISSQTSSHDIFKNDLSKKDLKNTMNSLQSIDCLSDGDKNQNQDDDKSGLLDFGPNSLCHSAVRSPVEMVREHLLSKRELMKQKTDVSNNNIKKNNNKAIQNIRFSYSINKDARIKLRQTMQMSKKLNQKFDPNGNSILTPTSVQTPSSALNVS